MSDKHTMEVYYSLGRIIRRPRGYLRCKRCGLLIHEDWDLVKKGDGSCE